MNTTYNSSEIPRVCKLHPNISCEECTENCPYIYCQHIVQSGISAICVQEIVKNVNSVHIVKYALNNQ